MLTLNGVLPHWLRVLYWVGLVRDGVMIDIILLALSMLVLSDQLIVYVPCPSIKRLINIFEAAPGNERAKAGRNDDVVRQQWPIL